MKLSLALFLLVALIVILLPDDSEANPLRRRQQARRFQRLRAGRTRNFRMRGKALRRGRTNMDAPPPPPEGADDPDAAGADGEGGEEVPAWCDPTTEMGAWLNYKQIRVICGERGFEDFGPYGGIPTEEEGEEGAEEAAEE